MKRCLVHKNSFILVFMGFFLASCSDDSPSETEISKASGTYILTELNISPTQDINEDGTASTNLLDELSCISGTLVLASNGTYSLELTGVEVTSITNGLFFINCGQARNSVSTWNIQNGMVTLFADVTTTPYTLVDNQLSRTPDRVLPGIQGVVYHKQ